MFGLMRDYAEKQMIQTKKSILVLVKNSHTSRELYVQLKIVLFTYLCIYTHTHPHTHTRKSNPYGDKIAALTMPNIGLYGVNPNHASSETTTLDSRGTFELLTSNCGGGWGMLINEGINTKLSTGYVLG